MMMLSRCVYGRSAGLEAILAYSDSLSIIFKLAHSFRVSPEVDKCGERPMMLLMIS
jgi:hypothetical protein